MKTLNTYKRMTTLCFTLIILTSSIPAFAYPEDPENAALLYYQAYMIYQEPKEDMRKTYHEVVTGKAKPDDRIRNFVKSSRTAIDLAIASAEIPQCNWGLQYKAGLSMQMTHLGSHKNLARLVIAEARILGAEGNYVNALDRCLTAYKMARHIGNELIIGYMVGVSTGSVTNKCVENLLPTIPPDAKLLKKFKTQLAQIEKRPFSLPRAIETDTKATAADITFDRKSKLEKYLPLELVAAATRDALKNRETPKKDPLEKILEERIHNGDEQFFIRNRTYWLNHAKQIIDALDLPYEKAFRRLKELEKEPRKEASENSDATLATFLAPATSRVYILSLRYKNQYNAIKAAIDIYLIKAETGNLPDILPADLPKDMFSGEDFGYEKTSDGFIIQCQGKGQDNNEIYEYEFKVAK